jgi:hypothetical protein
LPVSNLGSGYDEEKVNVPSFLHPQEKLRSGLTLTRAILETELDEGMDMHLPDKCQSTAVCRTTLIVAPRLKAIAESDSNVID